MEVDFIPHSDNPPMRSVSYSIMSSTGIQKGYAEGYLSAEDYLVSVINIFPDYTRKGIGRRAFEKVIFSLGGGQVIRGIYGSWHSGGEFNHLEFHMSTNLRIFNELLSQGYPLEAAAIQTPTGKWAKALGFLNVDMLNYSSEEASVLFY